MKCSRLCHQSKCCYFLGFAGCSINPRENKEGECLSFIHKDKVGSVGEICEWDNLPNGESTTGCGSLSVFIDNEFKYCPYCGKPIKIKE